MKTTVTTDTYTCDRCGAQQATDDRLSLPEGWKPLAIGDEQVRLIGPSTRKPPFEICASCVAGREKMKSYGAISPVQIIDLFEIRAKLALFDGEQPTLAEREAKVWREAADLLRNTEFVGWNQLEAKP